MSGFRHKLKSENGGDDDEKVPVLRRYSKSIRANGKTRRKSTGSRVLWLRHANTKLCNASRGYCVLECQVRSNKW